MLKENQLFEFVDKEKEAVDFLKSNVTEKDLPLLVAFSGGKDSIVVYDIVKKSGFPYEAVFSKTSVDPPELLKFISENYTEVKWNIPKETMFQLIVRKCYPPTRIARYCCEYLKEGSGKNRTIITGIRAEESHKRAKRGRMSDFKNKKILNPIFNFTFEDIWQYIRENKLIYPILYDEGFKRIGCIGCPMSGALKIKEEFERYPNFKRAYLWAFKKMIEERKRRNLKTVWKDENDVMSWWLMESILQECDYGQLDMDLV